MTSEVLDLDPEELDTVVGMDTVTCIRWKCMCVFNWLWKLGGHWTNV